MAEKIQKEISLGKWVFLYMLLASTVLFGYLCITTLEHLTTVGQSYAPYLVGICLVTFTASLGTALIVAVKGIFYKNPEAVGKEKDTIIDENILPLFKWAKEAKEAKDKVIGGP